MAPPPGAEALYADLDSILKMGVDNPTYGMHGPPASGGAPTYMDVKPHPPGSGGAPTFVICMSFLFRFTCIVPTLHVQLTLLVAVQLHGRQAKPPNRWRNVHGCGTRPHRLCLGKPACARRSVVRQCRWRPNRSAIGRRSQLTRHVRIYQTLTLHVTLNSLHH